MNSKFKKIILNIDDNKLPNWKLFLKNELQNTESTNIKIDCQNVELSCKDILDLIEIANQYDCKIIDFYSTSTKTIVSTQSLGYRSQFFIQDYPDNTLKINDKDLNFSKTDFHQGTVRSGQYLDSSNNLLILGDVNPGAIVRAEGNVIIWGRLLGIAHAGCKGNDEATISALQLRPVQLRISNKIARGPKEKPQIGFAEKAKLDSEEIIICPIDSI